MLIEKYIPAEILQPYIKTYLVIAYEDEVINRVLPDTNLTIAFRYKGQVNYLAGSTKHHLPLTLISGLRKSPRFINYTKNSGNVLVIFQEAGAAAFFREPLHELFEESIALDQLISLSAIAAIEAQLEEASDNKLRIAIVEQFLLSKLCRTTQDKLVVAALNQIHAANGNIKIKELAGSLFISQDALEKRFRRVVGTSPKQFCFIVRMKAVAAQNIQDRTFTDIAISAGYFDQPHFNKDFKLFTGQSPGDFFQSPPLW